MGYPATLKVFDTIRMAIVCQMAKVDKKLKGEIEADESYFGGKRKGNKGRGDGGKTIVFGILERDGKVSVVTPGRSNFEMDNARIWNSNFIKQARRIV